MPALRIIFRSCLVLFAFVLAYADMASAVQQQANKQPAKTPSKAATQPAAKAPARPATQAAQPAAQPLSEADVKAKQQILQSDRWRHAIAEMNEWLSVQTTYSPQQIERLKSDLAEKIESMTPADLETLLSRMEVKLDILLSPDAQAAREWVGQYLSVLAAKPKEEFKKRLPDPITMTPQQMQRELEAFKQRQASTKQAQAAMQQGREQRVQSIQSSRTQVAPTGQSRGSGSAQTYFGPTQSNYAPRQYERQQPNLYMQYYSTPWGGFGRR